MEAANLIALLERLNDIHLELLSLGERKTEVVKKGDMHGLNALLKEEDVHTKELYNIDVERTAIFGTVSVSELLLTCSTAEQEKINTLQQEIRKNYETLKKVNELNQQLIHQSLQLVNLSLNMMVPEPEPVTYSKPSRKGYGTAGTSLFDSKA